MPVAADSFLQAHRSDQLTKADVDRILLSEVYEPAHVAELRIEEFLRPMFAALPKSETGRLSALAVHHALHRFFVQEHGRHMKGLEHAGCVSSASFSSSIRKDRAPSYIQGLVEEHLQGEGLGLRELAVFAATLSNAASRHSRACGPSCGRVVWRSCGLQTTVPPRRVSGGP